MNTSCISDEEIGKCHNLCYICAPQIDLFGIFIMYFSVFNVSESNFVTFQIAKLELETNNLNEDYAQQKRNIEAREAEMNEQEAIAAKCREDFQSIKTERDALQENRK